MEAFDSGVNLAFWLTLLSTVLCVVYGVYHWNDRSEKRTKHQRTWVRHEEQMAQES